jgi:hypothetical protein
MLIARCREDGAERSTLLSWLVRAHGDIGDRRAHRLCVHSSISISTSPNRRVGSCCCLTATWRTSSTSSVAPPCIPWATTGATPPTPQAIDRGPLPCDLSQRPSRTARISTISRRRRRTVTFPRGSTGWSRPAACIRSAWCSMIRSTISRGSRSPTWHAWADPTAHWCWWRPTTLIAACSSPVFCPAVSTSRSIRRARRVRC